VILGVVQDASFPQVGCYQGHCLPAWQAPRKRRGAVSLGVVDPVVKAKYIFEATPNFPEQLFQLDQLAPNDDFKLKGIFLTHAHAGHYAWLMYLGKESMNTSNVPVYAMPRMHEYLANNGPWSQLVKLDNIRLQRLTDKQAVVSGNLTFTALIVPHRVEFSETVAYFIQGPSKTALFIADINKWSPGIPT
jgi:pyrroloquinoline quinone biosynthesis protein B